MYQNNVGPGTRLLVMRAEAVEIEIGHDLCDIVGMRVCAPIVAYVLILSNAG